jgi:hypothetical protein
MATPGPDLTDSDDRSAEKLARLRESAAEAFEELDRAK